MINLSPRQRAALLAGLELLREQIATRRQLPSSYSFSPAQLAELTAILAGKTATVLPVHKHALEGGRQRSYDTVGECSVHGTICAACEITWHLEDGPLEWCRECDRVLAAAGELAQSLTAKRGSKRRGSRTGPQH